MAFYGGGYWLSDLDHFNWALVIIVSKNEHVCDCLILYAAIQLVRKLLDATPLLPLHGGKWLVSDSKKKID